IRKEPDVKTTKASHGSKTSLVCASAKFPRIFREYNMDFRPDIVGLLEPKVSGSKADDIIAKLGFHHSYRIEARGFFGGIQVGWRDTIQLEIIQNHPQFILVKIHNRGIIQPILTAIVYKIPNPVKKKSLWEALKATIPYDNAHWITLGDFNAIHSEEDKKGGSTIGKRYPHFGELIESKNLQDLAIGNEAWCQ
ncbi:hypothetical protein Gogos_013180, partial [Gossypium gossypioides]|nr:hypothetical protein [Gossypium gossypioides]